MFDFGFSELLLIGVVALIVLGPERLPKVARAAGHWAGRIQYFVNNVKSELGRQIDASELSSVKKDVEDAAKDFKESFQSVGDSVKESSQAIRDGLDLRPAWERLPQQRTPADFGLDEAGKPLVDLHDFDADDYGSDYGLRHAPPPVSLKRRAMMQRRDMRPKYRARPRLSARKGQGS
ncbi:Sec-independent protein translocase protein TatB [Neisseria wadsworthii]|uniref:Sec-independent protein translocase protein TatB n=1 Tax=Neisseria wadsworthii TaxID=607711 RepID=UPI000D31D4DC|nr:Sec-independent protein translocase protein TatB [Neisseria wadsworthii]